MKGIGEVAMNGPLPAIANAVADACGARICHGPITQQRVLPAMVPMVNGKINESGQTAQERLKNV
jgi:hypothetical protein